MVGRSLKITEPVVIRIRVWGRGLTVPGDIGSTYFGLWTDGTIEDDVVLIDGELEILNKTPKDHFEI